MPASRFSDSERKIKRLRHNDFKLVGSAETTGRIHGLYLVLSAGLLIIRYMLFCVLLSSSSTELRS